MPVVLDAPAPTVAVDPHRFEVRGWVWLGGDQSQIERVEAWCDGCVVGAADRLIARPDVNAALGLSHDTRAGFQFYAHHPHGSSAAEFNVEVRARLRSGESVVLTTPVAITRLNLGLAPEFVHSRPAEPTHEAHTARWLGARRDGKRDFGVEIGAFQTPIPGIRPLYLDRFPAYDYQEVNADYWADAMALPVRDHGLDYVANANVFEHLPNPVGALWEWARAVRDLGYLYLVIPDRRLTFDHPRPLTAPEHMMEDFSRNTTDSDGTHIAEYLDGVDWALWAPHATPEERVATRENLRVAYNAAVAAGEPINIHFHTFELSSFVRLLELANRSAPGKSRLELVDASEFFPASHPSGFLVVLRARKSFGASVAGAALRLRCRGDVRAALAQTAKAFRPAKAEASVR